MPLRSFRSDLPLDLKASLAPVRAGHGDPSVRIVDGEVLFATRTPDGPGTIHLHGGGHEIEAETWGSGAEWLAAHAPAICGAGDRLDDFSPVHDIVGRLAKRYRGVRVIQTGAIVEALIRTVVGQKVTGSEAKAGYRRMAAALGEPAPGPHPLMLPPGPEALAGLAYHRFHPWGIERKRAETIIRIARRRNRLAETTSMDLPDAYRRLQAMPGIGAWTCGVVGGVVFGDPDAVPIGDYHIPNIVSWMLAGEPRADDARMLELLEPYRGHRGRVVRYLKAAGIKPPRYGPRAPLRSIRDS